VLFLNTAASIKVSSINLFGFNSFSASGAAIDISGGADWDAKQLTSRWQRGRRLL
jgi:hypothetical protein